MIDANKIEYWSGIGDARQVSEAIAAGYDVNQQSEGGYTALHAAAENNRLDVIQLLIENGADVDARVLTGMTPLDMAQAAAYEEAVALLKEFGATSGGG